MPTGVTLNTVSTISGELTIAQTAELVGVSQPTVRRWIANGELRAHRYGARNIRIDPSDLRRFRREVNPATFSKVHGGDVA